MKKNILVDGKWTLYNKNVLRRDVAYKFVAWIEEGEGIILLLPEDISSEKLFRHNYIINKARVDGIVNVSHEPNVYGALCVVFDDVDDVNRIVSWTSQEYGRTEENLRKSVREALELGDVVY